MPDHPHSQRTRDDLSTTVPRSVDPPLDQAVDPSQPSQPQAAHAATDVRTNDAGNGPNELPRPPGTPIDLTIPLPIGKVLTLLCKTLREEATFIRTLPFDDPRRPYTASEDITADALEDAALLIEQRLT